MLNLNNYPNLRAVHVIKDEQTIFEYRRANEMETSLFPIGCIFNPRI